MEDDPYFNKTKAVLINGSLIASDNVSCIDVIINKNSLNDKLNTIDSNLKYLESQIKLLQVQIEKNNQMILEMYYAPGMPGYIQAQMSFENHQNSSYKKRKFNE